jgi:hypothetical protein
MNDKPFKNFFKINMSYWLLVVPILYTTVPWVNYRMRGLVPSFAALLWLLPKISKIMAKFNCREGRAFFAAIFWFLILMFLREIFAIIGSQEHMQYHHVATICMQLCYFFVAFYTIAYRKFNELRFLTMITLGGFILSGIGAVRGMGVEGLESARNIVSLQNAGHSISQDTIDNAINIVNFGLCKLVGLRPAIFPAVYRSKGNPQQLCKFCLTHIQMAADAFDDRIHSLASL